MIEKLKELWKWHRPIFMTGRKLFSLLVSAGVEQDKNKQPFHLGGNSPCYFQSGRTEK